MEVSFCTPPCAHPLHPYLVLTSAPLLHVPSPYTPTLCSSPWTPILYSPSLDPYPMFTSPASLPHGHPLYSYLLFTPCTSTLCSPPPPHPYPVLTLCTFTPCSPSSPPHPVLTRELWGTLSLQCPRAHGYLTDRGSRRGRKALPMTQQVQRPLAPLPSSLRGSPRRAQSWGTPASCLPFLHPTCPAPCCSLFMITAKSSQLMQSSLLCVRH